MMNEEGNMISQMRAVTISREYGSGGGEVAARLAQRLQRCPERLSHLLLG